MSLAKAIAIAEEAINYDNLEMDYESIQKYREAVAYLKCAHKGGCGGQLMLRSSKRRQCNRHFG